MIKTVKEYFLPIISALTVFVSGTVLQADKLFFNYPDINFKHMIFIKSLYLIFLCCMFCFGFKVFKEIKTRNEIYKRGFNIFLVYFSIISGLIIITWPGMWSWDDIWILVYDYKYDFLAWQHVITSIFHQIFLQILPFPCGIIIMQNLVISIAVAYITLKLESVYNIRLKNKFFDLTLKLIPFLLFPVLRYQLSGYRIGFYIFFEAAFLCFLLCMLKEKKEESSIKLLVFSVLCAIVSCWRSESIIYIIAGILFFICHKPAGNRIKRAVFCFLMLIIYVAASVLQGYGVMKDGNNRDYELTATVSQMSELVRGCDKNSPGMKQISKVINIDAIYDNPDMSGIDLFWYKDLVKKNYSREEYFDYLNGYMILIINNPEKFLKERFETIKISSGIYGEKNVPGTGNILNVFNNDSEQKFTDVFFKNPKFILNRPIFENLRTKSIIFICLKDYPEIYKIVWNWIFSFCILVLFTIISVIKKQKAEVAVSSAFLTKQISVMLTQPAPYIQYYLSLQLIGYIILICFLIKKISEITVKSRV